MKSIGKVSRNSKLAIKIIIISWVGCGDIRGNQHEFELCYNEVA